MSSFYRKRLGGPLHKGFTENKATHEATYVEKRTIKIIVVAGF